jgi:hypothetical protein
MEISDILMSDFTLMKKVVLVRFTHLFDWESL